MGKINDFVVEFGYWLYTEEGMYYKELCSAWFVLIMFLLIVISDIILAINFQNPDLLIISVLFGYLAFRKIKRVKSLMKKGREAIFE